MDAPLVPILERERRDLARAMTIWINRFHLSSVRPREIVGMGSAHPTKLADQGSEMRARISNAYLRNESLRARTSDCIALI